eukprot:GGOE01025582.1.p2 GENE.GGOE01025582.1~~GGOE01025582.1.p2  ORF type:complete len:151 (+),score=5.95 GGOE01025582.1:437-889(+)
MTGRMLFHILPTVALRLRAGGDIPATNRRLSLFLLSPVGRRETPTPRSTHMADLPDGHHLRPLLLAERISARRSQSFVSPWRCTFRFVFFFFASLSTPRFRNAALFLLVILSSTSCLEDNSSECFLSHPTVSPFPPYSAERVLSDDTARN